MTRRTKHFDTDAPQAGPIMALAMLTGAKTVRSRAANDADAPSRPNILVSRRRRSARREAH